MLEWAASMFGGRAKLCFAADRATLKSVFKEVAEQGADVDGVVTALRKEVSAKLSLQIAHDYS